MEGVKLRPLLPKGCLPALSERNHKVEKMVKNDESAAAMSKYNRLVKRMKRLNSSQIDKVVRCGGGAVPLSFFPNIPAATPNNI